MTRADYRASLGTAVAASAAPYGYTLTIWTSGAVIADARGFPSGLDALVFMLGAVVGFAALGLLSHGRVGSQVIQEPLTFALWKSFHVVPIGAALGAAALDGHFLQDEAAWPVGGFLATTLYLAGVAFQLALGREYLD